MEARKIIITGGATRIGAAIAEKLSGPNIEITIHYNKSKSKAESLKKKLLQFGTKVHLIKGDFTQTFEKTDTGKLALVFVDCDSYRGTEYLIEKIFDHCLAVSGLMLFEDYGHASLLGNRLAVHKFFDRKKNAFCFFSQFSGTFIVCKTY